MRSTLTEESASSSTLHKVESHRGREGVTYMMQGDKVVNIAHSLNKPSGTRPKFSRQSISPCRTLDESWTRLLCPREMIREVGRWTKAALAVGGVSDEDQRVVVSRRGRTGLPDGDTALRKAL